MIDHFVFDNYRLFSIYEKDVDFYVCLSANQQEDIFMLQNPHIIYLLPEVNENRDFKIINVDQPTRHQDEHSVLTNINNKFDKKNKVNVRQEESIEVRKNKAKFKKKVRNKISLEKEDLFLKSSNNSVLNEDSLNLSIVRQPKYSKHKKKDKLKQNSPRDHINNDIKVSKDIILERPLTIQELSTKLKIPEAEIITWLFLKGISVTINQVVDISIATEVAVNYDFHVVNPDIDSSNHLKFRQSYVASNSDQEIKRPPIITILGHVDHGKTTLLDTIRNTNLVKQEAGSITQSIAGYEVDWLYGSSLQKMVFLDTPGHEAFTSMRLRGAQVTDIALLVVAADDGLKPQTVEAIEHIKNHSLACIVAINKTDKKNIDILKVKEELAKQDILVEDWGGNVPVVEVSGLTGKNIDVLLSSICVLAELQELKADPTQLAQGTILEAHLDKSKGAIANVIVQNGTLKIGDLIISGKVSGKVKAIVNNMGVKIDEAQPSSIIEVWGFSSVPQAGANFEVVKDEKSVKQVINRNMSIDGSHDISKILNSRITLDTYSRDLSIKQLNLIIKADTQGSVEAIIHSFSQIPQDKVQINILSANSGSVSDTDVELALTSNSLIIAFNVYVPINIYNTAEKSRIRLKHFTVIYDLLDYIREYMLDLLDPEYDQVLIGTAIVQTVFYINKRSVAGCLVNAGKLKKQASISVYRNKNLVHSGLLDSLKRIKDDVSEVSAGNECGVMCNNYHLWQKQDVIEVYELNERKKVL